MRESTQHSVLGAFIIGAIIIISIGFLLMAGQGYDKNAQKVVMVFDGSVKGLTIGAPVALRGVNIGEVTDIRVRFKGDNDLSLLMEVEALLDESRVTRGQGNSQIGQELIVSGLRAQLNTQSLLTGLLYIQLDFFPGTESILRDANAKYFEIPTIPSPFEQLIDDFGQLNLPRLASDLQKTVAALRHMTESEDFQALPQTVNSALTASEALATETMGLLARLEPKIDETLSSTAKVANTLEQDLPAISQHISDSLTQLDSTLRSFERAGENLSGVLNPDSPTLYRVNETLESLSRASESLSRLAQSLEEQPQSLLLGRPEESR